MIKKFIITLLSVLTFNAIAQTNTVQLHWTAHCNTNVTTYTIHYGTNLFLIPLTKIIPSYIDDCGVTIPAETNIFKCNYNLTQNVIGITNTTTVISNLVKGSKYYFSITAKTASNVESEKSVEVEYIVPLYSSNSVPSRVRGVHVIEIK